MKTCEQCKRQYNPSSRHKVCPACRQKNSMVPCSTCGEPAHKTSKVCRNCVTQKGENNPNWKGGLIHIKQGYVMRSAPGHPRASKRNSYVFEHILVMEDHLGRYLVEGENVHHINGIKHDNSLNNLELWAKPQPTGVRAKDLYAWAKQIVELYENDLDKL